MTYTETKGNPPFDWRHALTHLEEHDIEDICTRARKWSTCACGGLSADIPRRASGAPVDDELRTLGLRFVCEVFADQWTDALETLSRIEQRSAELLK